MKVSISSPDGFVLLSKESGLIVINLNQRNPATIEVNIDEVQYKSSRHRNNLMLVINNNRIAIIGTSLTTDPNNNLKIIEGKNQTPLYARSVKFKIIRNGVGELLIPYGIVDQDSPTETWKSGDGNIAFKYRVKGIPTPSSPIEPQEEVAPPPVNEMTQEERDWRGVENGTIIQIHSGYIQKYPNGRFTETAQTKIRQLELKEWRSVEARAFSFEACTNYLELFQGILEQYGFHKNNVLQYLNNPIIKTPIPLKKEDEENAIAEENEPEISVDNSILPDLKVAFIGKEGDYFIYKVLNGVSPIKYKDESHFPITIDFSQWIEDTILKLRKDSENGDLSVRITDGNGRWKFISLDEELKAEIQLVGDSLLIFSMRFGNKPYVIELLDYSTNEPKWTQRTNEEKFSITLSKLAQIKGLGGKVLKASVRDESATYAEIFEGEILIPQASIYRKLWFLGVCSLSLVSLTAYFLIKRYAKKDPMKEY